MRDGILGFLVVLVLIGILMIVGWGTSWFGLVTGRPMAKYAEQTRHEVFQQSAAREEGINKSILSECLSMRSAADASSKQAMAKFILSDVGMYEGHLTPDALDCVREARAQ